MSSSLTLGQIAKQAPREKAKLEGRVKCLQDHLGKLMSERSKSLRRSNSTSGHEDSSSAASKQENEDNPFASSSDAFSRGRGRRHHRTNEGSRDDFRVDIPEFEG